MIPADWKEVRLGDLGPLSKGVGIRKNEVTPYGIPCVRYGQIYTDYNFVIGEIQSFVSPQVASNSRRLRKGEILFAGSGETKEDIGKCIAYVKDVGAVAGGDIVVLTPEGADSRFLGYSLNSPNVAKQKMSRAQGDAVVHISAANLASIVLDLPPLKEQEAIAEVLSNADAAIESLGALISKKRDMKQSAMQQLLTGRTRLPGFTAEWQRALLGDFASLSAAPAKPSGGSRYVIVDMGSVAKDGSLLTHKKTDAKDDLLEVGDLVMPKDDIGGGQIIGKAIHIDAPNQYVLGDHVYRLRLSQGYPPYVRYAINSHQVNSSLRSKVVGSAQLGLGRRSVLEQPIPFPPLGEQIAIAEVLSDMDAEIDALVAQREKAELVKQGMMQELLSGRVRLA